MDVYNLFSNDGYDFFQLKVVALRSMFQNQFKFYDASKCMPASNNEISALQEKLTKNIFVHSIFDTQKLNLELYLVDCCFFEPSCHRGKLIRYDSILKKYSNLWTFVQRYQVIQYPWLYRRGYELTHQIFSVRRRRNKIFEFFIPTKRKTLKLSRYSGVKKICVEHVLFENLFL